MLSTNFRPWGHFDWVHSRLEPKTWDFLGCLGTEDRYNAAATEAKHKSTLSSTSFINVIDTENEYTHIAEPRKKLHYLELKHLFKSTLRVSELELLGSPKILKSFIEQFISTSNGNVILDISCFPKRFFFPILKLLYNSEDVKDLLVCYTSPETYFEEDMAENPLPWAHIPMFQRTAVHTPKIEKAIVGVGFLPFGLPSLLKSDYSNAKLTLLFPFPPGPPNYQRTWDFVREIEKFYPLKTPQQLIRVGGLNVSGCFDHISNITDDGRTPVMLAPYGPKTQSLAMALFAIKHDCDVFYTQPQQYHPEYSRGINHYDGMKNISTYCVKLGGTKLY